MLGLPTFPPLSCNHPHSPTGPQAPAPHTVLSPPLGLCRPVGTHRRHLVLCTMFSLHSCPRHCQSLNQMGPESERTGDLRVILGIFGAKAGGFTGSTGVQSWPCPLPPHGFSSCCPSGTRYSQQTLSQTPTLLSRIHRLRSHPNLNSHPRLSFRGPLCRWHPSRYLNPALCMCPGP